MFVDFRGTIWLLSANAKNKTKTPQLLANFFYFKVSFVKIKERKTLPTHAESIPVKTVTLCACVTPLCSACGFVCSILYHLAHESEIDRRINRCTLMFLSHWARNKNTKEKKKKKGNHIRTASASSCACIIIVRVKPRVYFRTCRRENAQHETHR